MAGQYNQDRSMAGRYRTGVYMRNPLVPSYHSATTLGGDYTSRHQGEKTLPTRSEEEQTVVRICKPNSKISPFTDVDLTYVLCSLFFAPLCTDFNFLSV
jgi:hypothetical protein